MNVRKAFDPSPDILVYGVEINREQTAFAAACEDGFRGWSDSNAILTYSLTTWTVYDTKTCGLRSFREFAGSLKFATILDKSNLIGLLGARKGAPRACPKDEVCIIPTSTSHITSPLIQLLISGPCHHTMSFPETISSLRNLIRFEEAWSFCKTSFHVLEETYHAQEKPPSLK